MYTTIKISKELKRKLDSMKMRDSETYQDILEDLVEDRLEINESTKAQIKKSIAQYRNGQTITLAELKRKAGLDV